MFSPIYKIKFFYELIILEHLDLEEVNEEIPQKMLRMGHIQN